MLPETISSYSCLSLISLSSTSCLSCLDMTVIVAIIFPVSNLLSSYSDRRSLIASLIASERLEYPLSFMNSSSLLSSPGVSDMLTTGITINLCGGN